MLLDPDRTAPPVPSRGARFRTWFRRVTGRLVALIAAPVSRAASWLAARTPARLVDPLRRACAVGMRVVAPVVAPVVTLARAATATRARRLALGAATVGVTVAGAGAWWTTCGFDGCPTAAELQAWRPSEGGRVLDREGRLLAAMAPIRRVNVPIADVPAHVREAFLAVEDRRFHAHHGVDRLGVLRASWRNLRAGGVREGASTITMQLARNAFLADRPRGLRKKLLEVRYAGLLERALPKDVILGHYLNTIYLGAGTYGVEAASRDLFGVSVRRVDVAQAALLAGLPKAPSTYTPRRSVAAARARRDVVLAAMVDADVLSARDADAARRTPVRIARTRFTGDAPTASWGVLAVRATVDSLQAVGALPREVSAGDLVVHTTLDASAQRAAQAAVTRGARTLDRRRGRVGDDVTQGALVALDPADGAIRALVGGRSVEAGGFDRARRAQRQPGSAFKPFVYAVAIADGASPLSPVLDEPVTLRVDNRDWSPANAGGRYLGRVTYREALARSANSAAVRIARDVRPARIADFAERLGVAEDLPDVPSLALGAAGVTPLALATGYAAFANGGWRVTPHLVTRVESPDGRVLWERAPVAARRVLAPTDAFLVTSMLRSVVDEGTGRAVRAAGVRGPVAGKTGTTNDGADTWFVGYTPSLVAAVWLGADRPVSLGRDASGGRDAAPVWAAFVRDGWRSPSRERAWPVPPGLVAVEVERGSGALSTGMCAGETYTEYVRPGQEPTAPCEGGGWWWRAVQRGLDAADWWDRGDDERARRARDDRDDRGDVDDGARDRRRSRARPAAPRPPEPPTSLPSEWQRAIEALPPEAFDEIDAVLDALAAQVDGDRLSRAIADAATDALREQLRALQREAARRVPRD